MPLTLGNTSAAMAASTAACSAALACSDSDAPAGGAVSTTSRRAWSSANVAGQGMAATVSGWT